MADACKASGLDSYIVQRLERPRKSLGERRVIKAFGFGGGGSGFSDEEYEIVSDIWTYQYMGNAEYEHGAPRNAIVKTVELAAKREMVAFELVVPLVLNLRWKERKKIKAKARNAVIWMVTPKNIKEKAVAWIIAHLASDRQGAETKQPTLMSSSILWRESGDPAGTAQVEPKIVAWQDLDHYWSAFLYEDMWRKFCDVFCIDTQTVKTAGKGSHAG